MAALAMSAGAQVYQTLPQYSNPIRSGQSASSAFATPVSGSTYASTNRPAESGAGRFKIDNFQAGAPFSSAPPDFNFGDIITPPPLTDTSKAPTIVTTNGAFYMTSRKQLVAAQGGACTVLWPKTDGTTNSVTYTIGSVPSLSASRLFWTDNYIAGGVNTNSTSVPDNTDYAVSLSGIYAKVHYNIAVPDFDTVNSQNNAAGRSARASNAGTHLDLSATWIDGNSVLRARNQSGFFILEYFDTSGYDNSVGYEIVYVGPAKVYQSAVKLGDRLLPSEGAAVAGTLRPSTSKAGNYVVQWTANGSHFYNWIFAKQVNSDDDHPDGDSSKTQILWQKTGNLQVVWPYEPHWYSITWPGDDVAKVFAFDSLNPTNSPTATIPTNYTATVVWSEATDKIIKADSASSVITPVGEGRALIQYQNNTDVWFIPVRVAARNNGAYYSNLETFWPVGLPLQPVVNRPRFSLNGIDNYLTFEAGLQPNLSVEMWIKPGATTNNQTLAAILDYPQQASVQAMLSLTNGNVKLAILTSSGAVSTLVSSSILTPNTWSHVAFTKSSGGGINLYVNGAPDGSMGVSKFNAQNPNVATYSQMVFGKAETVNGANQAATTGFAGEIKEIRMWDAELSSGYIRKHLADQLDGDEDTLAHLIKPTWLESYTPTEGSDGSTFLTPDYVTGDLVSGFGSFSTSGQTPFSLANRLMFNGVDDYATMPVAWNKTDSRTLEFWGNFGDVASARTIVALGASSGTNLLLSLSGGRLVLTSGSLSSNGPHVDSDVDYHIAIVGQGSQATLYVDAVSKASVALNNSSVTGTNLIVGAGAAGAGLFNGELRDVRIYTAARSSSQIAADRTSVPDLTDPDLVRSLDFDRISPAVWTSLNTLQIPEDARGFDATYHGTPIFGTPIAGRTFVDVAGGVIRSGTAYHNGIYTNEFRIIPVNDTPTNSVLEVWWNDTFNSDFLAQPFSFPSIVSRYRLMDPLAPPILVLAGQNFSGYRIPTTWAEPKVYFQNDPAQIGYNPNEEHALIVGSSLYAIRWDLNSDNTSHGYALLQYKDENRNSLSYLQPIAIAPTNSVYPNFDGSLEVGQLLQAPTPLVDLPTSSLSGPLSGADPKHRLYQDREFFWWARSAVSSGPPDSVVSRWWYPLQDSFYWPTSLGLKNPGDPVPFGNTTNGLAINYTVRWPDVVPHLALGESLMDAMPSAIGDGYLPAVTGQKSVEILYDDASTNSRTSAYIIDPTNPSTADLANLNNVNTATDVQLGKTYFTLLPPHLRERVYWDPQTKKLNLLGQIVRPITGFPYLLPAWLGAAGDPNSDYTILAGLSADSTWQAAVNALRKNANIIPDAETPFDNIALSPTGTAGGYMTLGVNTRQAFNLTGDPISLYPIFVDTNLLYTGSVIVMFSANKFDEYTTLRHSGDFGGNPSLYQFDWRYSFPEQGQVPTSSPDSWISYMPITTGLNRIVFGGPGLLTLKDVYFSVRWRCISSTAPNKNWSGWTSPALVQSWLTRALDGINPFEQRVDSLANNHLDLTTSILSQAGKRFVGAVPLNMDNVNNYGLIEIYETLLQRARELSIDAGYSDDDVNASLLDAASKLNELYGMLGDEASTDAKDPTVAWGSRDLNDVYFGSRASSLFAFQGIVPSLLEEELALLRGLDDTTSTPVTTYPVYNRLYWNFTKGINSGEPAYALNYGIQSVTTNSIGSITEADAAKWYPQGHGDAYGHYLTALSSYYKLLNNTNFTWFPRAEVKVIGGVNVTFDYVDERKMAASALDLAKTGVEIIDRTFKRDFRLDPTKRIPLFQDSNTNRAWSATEWCDRVSQGVLYNWILVNSLLPAPTPVDTAQTVSRATVPELQDLAGISGTVQDIADAIDRGDSPMQVAANVVPFDLDPTLIDAGVSHFEQIYARAVTAMQSAYAILQRASASAANLRRQDVSLETFRYQIAQREAEFNAQLIDIYGTPYADDIGPTGTFSSGYYGPDLYHFNYIDRELFSPADAGAVTNVAFHAQYAITGDNIDTLSPIGTNIVYQVNNDGIPLLPNAWTGQRAVYGKIQAALGDYIRAWINLRGAVANQTELSQELEARLQRLRDHNAYSASYGAIGDSLSAQKQAVDLLQELADSVVAALDEEKQATSEVAESSSDATPKSLIAGLADGGDLSFPARIGIGVSKIAAFLGFTSAQGIANLSSYAAGKASTILDDQISANEDAFNAAEYQSQTALETTVLLSRVNAGRDSIYAAAVAFRQAWQNYTTLVSRGNQLQSDLVTFRAANAARVQEARYADVIFRVFRNEDLEDYTTAFDQAVRYAYAAARVYDYETGLLDPNVVSGHDNDFIGEVMTARQLGDMVNGQPVPGSSSSSSLASVLDHMRANWSTLKGRFGINNPTLETHVISLRQELFRIGNSTNAAAQEANDNAWQNQLYNCKIADIRQLAEFKNFCQLYSPMAANEPAIVIPFSTEISAGKNVFGLPLAGGDTVFDPAHFTTKIRGATVTFTGYKDNAGTILAKTPRVYLVPVGIDRQRTPISGGTEIRDWHVVDQVWPIPFPSASGNVTLPLQSLGTDNLHVIRRFAPMRAYDENDLNGIAKIPYDSRLIGRSVWNTRWVLIIPASSLSSSTTTALDTFIESIGDIKLLLATYSYSGN